MYCGQKVQTRKREGVEREQRKSKQAAPIKRERADMVKEGKPLGTCVNGERKVSRAYLRHPDL